jgi:hypothetical protein
VRSLDEDLGEFLASRSRDSAGEQLRHAARVVASSPDAITAITCVHRARANQVPELSGLARCLASNYGLRVDIDVGDQLAIRFSRFTR